MHHRSAHDVLEHRALRRVHVRVDALGENRRDVHVLVVDVLRTQVTGCPAAFVRRGSQLAPLASVHDALGLVAVTPQSLELKVVLAFVIRFGDYGFGNSALTGLGLVFGHDLLLRFTEGLGGVALILFGPLIEATCDLILHVRAADLHLRDSYIAVTLLILVGEERLTEGAALVVVDAPLGSATISDLLFAGGGLILRQVQPVLTILSGIALVVGDVVVHGTLDTDRAVPGTVVTVTLTAEHRVTFNEGNLEVLRIWVFSPNAKLLTSSGLPLVDSTESIGPVRQANRVRTVSLSLRGVDRRYGATLLLVGVVDPLSIDLDTRKRFVNILSSGRVAVAVQENFTVDGLLCPPLARGFDRVLSGLCSRSDLGLHHHGASGCQRQHRHSARHGLHLVGKAQRKSAGLPTTGDRTPQIGHVASFRKIGSASRQPALSKYTLIVPT